MNKESLVVLKGKTKLVVEATGNSFEPNKHYRAVKQDDNSIIVFGELLDMDTFNNMFEFLHDRMIREFEAKELIKDGKPLSKTAFKERLGLHTYGRGKGKLFIGFFGDKLNGIWAFYGSFRGDTKAEYFKDAYSRFLKIIDGEMDWVDNETIQRGNSGIPISYGDVYFRPEYNPHNEKREIYC